MNFENLFSQLGESFYTAVMPQPLRNSYLIANSRTMLDALGISSEHANSEHFRRVFTGEIVAENSRPLAAVYSGHQFGVWAGQLGDGRALLLGDLPVTSKFAEHISTKRLEVQLKGAGETPYSRMGDGRAVLRSSVREFLCSEAMAGLGIPTSRALTLIGSDQYVMRETPEKSAIVTRLAPSFIRFGSFEHWYYQGELEKLRQLADFTIANYFPDFADHPQPYQRLLQEIVLKTADLMAHWQSVGFMHGVMNTDNMSILGLTLDYGPFGFMDAYNPSEICNHSDTQGRYAFNMQPRIGQWNCHALAQAMLPLIGDIDSAQEALSHYVARFETTHRRLLGAKFGLKTETLADDELFSDFLDILASGGTDYTIAFRALSRYNSVDVRQNQTLRDIFADRTALDTWLTRYQARLQIENSDDSARHQAMLNVNPKFILRNYLAQQAIERAEQKDFSEVQKLLKILETPFDEQTEHEDYAKHPPEWARTISVSCSS